MPDPDPLNPSTTPTPGTTPVTPAAPTATQQPTAAPASQTEAQAPDTTTDQQKVAQGNYQAERESIIKRHSEKMNFKGTGSTGSYEMAMAGNYIVAAVKKLSDELKLLDKQYADKHSKPSTPTPTPGPTPNVTNTANPMIATQKLLDLLKVLEPATINARVASIEQWEQAHPGKRFDEALDNAFKDYRTATETERTPSGPDQDPLSRVETLASLSVVNEKNLKTIEDSEATKVTEAVTQVEQEVARAAVSR